MNGNWWKDAAIANKNGKGQKEVDWNNFVDLFHNALGYKDENTLKKLQKYPKM